MFGQRQLNGLRERKRLLILQSDLHRALLRSECVSASERLRWLNEARDKVRSASPWLAVGAGIAGLVAASRGRTVAKWIPTVLTAWRWLRTLR
jgi:hypothetical protein